MEKVETFQQDMKRGETGIMVLGSTEEFFAIADSGIMANKKLNYPRPYQNPESYKRYKESVLLGNAEKPREIEVFSEKIHEATGITEKAGFQYTEDGGDVCVSRYLDGRRDCFVRRKKKEVAKSIAIIINTTVWHRFSKDQLENRMAAICGLIKTAKTARPVRVFLNSCGYQRKSSQGIEGIGHGLLEVTNADNAQMLTFCSEKWARLACFSFQEAAWGAKKGYSGGFSMEISEKSVTLSSKDLQKIKAQAGCEEVIQFVASYNIADYEVMDQAVNQALQIYQRRAK